jgi:ABC-type sugar transport system substrate-binding protein
MQQSGDLQQFYFFFAIMYPAIFLSSLSSTLFLVSIFKSVRSGYFLRLCVGLSFLSVIICSCTGDQTQKKYKIGFSQCTGGDAWRKQMLASMKGELAFYPDIEFQYSDAANSNEQQIKDIEAFIKQRVDLLIVSPNEAAPITPVVEKAFQLGIPVVIVDRRTTSSFYTAYIGADNYAIGKLAGSYVAELLAGFICR